MFNVYKISNIVNGKKYIGVTTRSVEDRFNSHWYKRHSNDSAIAMALRKYGKENFTIEIIDKANSKEEMFQLERKYIKEYNSYEEGYNLTLGGEGKATVDYTDEEIIEEYLLLKSSEKVSESLSIGSNTVLRVLKAHEIELFGSGYDAQKRVDSKKVVKRYRELKSIAKVAKDLDISKSTVSRKLIEEDEPLYRYGFSKEEELDIVNYYINSFKSMTALEKELGISRKVISRILKDNKVKIKNRTNSRPIQMTIEGKEFIFESVSDCAYFILEKNLTKSKTLKTIMSGINYSLKNNTPYYNMKFKDLKI